MSHTTEIDADVQDLDALEQACTALGLELVRGQTSYKNWGNPGTCLHAIRIPGNQKAYEIGVARRTDGQPGFALLWDSFNGGYGLVDNVGPEAVRLCDHYSAQVTMNELIQDGFTVALSLDQEGAILIDAQRY